MMLINICGSLVWNLLCHFWHLEFGGRSEILGKIAHPCFICYFSKWWCLIFGANYSVLVDPNLSLRTGSVITVKEML